MENTNELVSESQEQLSQQGGNESTKTPLTDSQLQFASYLEQVFRLKGELPTYEACKNAGVVYSHDQYERFWNSNRIRSYLRGIGIDVNRINGHVLTPLQLLTINTLLDGNDKRSNARKLKELGVPSRSFQAWQADPAFRSYFQSRVKNIIGPEGLPEIERALYERATAGDVSAAKFLLEYTGEYKSTPASSDFDSRTLVLKILEILQIRLAGHPELLAAIGSDLNALANEGNIVLGSPVRQTQQLEG